MEPTFASDGSYENSWWQLQICSPTIVSESKITAPPEWFGRAVNRTVVRDEIVLSYNLQVGLRISAHGSRDSHLHSELHGLYPLVQIG